MPRQPLVQAQEPLADPEAVRVGGGEARVVGDHAEVADVVVQPLELEEDHAQVPRAGRRDGAGQRLDRLAVGQRVPDARVPGHPLGELDAVLRRPALEELLGSLVGEVQARLHVDDRLAHDTEAEVTGLDDAGVDRPDRDLVHSLPADLAEGEGLAVVVKVPRRGVLAEREVVLRPERVADQRAGIGMPARADAELVEDLALEARRRVVEGGQGRDLRPLRVDRHRDVEEPALAGVAEEVVDRESLAVLSPVGADHEDRLGPEGRAHPPRERRHVVRRPGAVELAVSLRRTATAPPGNRCASAAARLSIVVMAPRSPRSGSGASPAARARSGRGRRAPRMTARAARAARARARPPRTPGGGDP